MEPWAAAPFGLFTFPKKIRLIVPPSETENPPLSPLPPLMLLATTLMDEVGESVVSVPTRFTEDESEN